MDEPVAARRRVLKAALGGAVAVGAVGGAVRWWPGDTPLEGGRPTLVLAGDDAGQMSSVEVPLDDRRLARPSTRSRWQTDALSTSVYSMLALTWDDPTVWAHLEVRTRSGGSWREWGPVPPLHDRPDDGDPQEIGRGGTEIVWTGRCDAVQVRGDGSRPRGLVLLLLRPWAQPGDDAPEPLALARTTTAPVPRPEIRSRRQWGATESWRDGSPRYNHTIKQVHVHHTVNSNGYSRRDVPALIRGIYRYHTHYLGWSDVGYNFLVDRFGRIWMGRAGGAGKPVRGAHTLGFNGTSTGVSVIGNFETATPSSAVLDAIAALAAWKLRPYDRDPEGLVSVWSEGSDKYRRGQVVQLPVIDGHRNTNDTACPGEHLYDAIPEIRRRAAHLIEYYSKVHVLEAPTVVGEPAFGRTLTVQGGRFDPADVSLTYTWLRDGMPIKDAHKASYTIRSADLGTRLSVRLVARKPGLRRARRTLWSSRRVDRVASTVRIVPHPRGEGRLRVDVQVASPDGVRTARGKVVVKLGDRRDVVLLEDGHGVAKFGWVHPVDAGRYRVRATYLGDRAHEPDRAVVRARVRR